MEHLRVATPCEASWQDMAGDERVRHCTLCSLNVYNFSEMTRDEIRALLLQTEGRICGRLYRRADGTLLTRDCPTGLRAVRQRVSRVAAAVIAALFSVSAFASGNKTCVKPQLEKHGSKVILETERIATLQQAMFTGVVRDEAGDLLPGVSIVLRDELGKREQTAVTNANGTFAIPLSDGLYRVELSLPGFTPAVLEHLELKQCEVTRAQVALRVDNSVTMGVIVVDPVAPTDHGMRTTFSQDLINKLPI